MVSGQQHAPAALYPPGKDPVSILQEAGWAPGPVWTGGKYLPHRDSIPDREEYNNRIKIKNLCIKLVKKNQITFTINEVPTLHLLKRHLKFKFICWNNSGTRLIIITSIIITIIIIIIIIITIIAVAGGG